MATYHLLDDGDSTLTRYVNDAEAPAVYMAAFRIRVDGEFVHRLRWSEVLRGFNTLDARAKVHAVTSFATIYPTIAGFIASATWGEDDHLGHCPVVPA